MENEKSPSVQLLDAYNELTALKKVYEKISIELEETNKELTFQKEENNLQKMALVNARTELVLQAEEKAKRAEELKTANKELSYQSEEKEKRAMELGVANKELLFQNEEKEKRAQELAVANKELLFQVEEKEKRAIELVNANKELLAFTYISSHDLQEPLRKIQTFATIITEKEAGNLSENGLYNFERMRLSAARMQQLIDDLLTFSRINVGEITFKKTDLGIILEDVKFDLHDKIEEKHARIIITDHCTGYIIAFQFRQLMYNLLTNALKFSDPTKEQVINISCKIIKGKSVQDMSLSPERNYCHITVADNGIGFDLQFRDRIFGVFQKLHSREEYAGTGIGLAIVKKIVENHHGFITATSELGKGATFDIYLPEHE